MHSLFLNTVLLGGTAADKLSAAQAAGFDAVELWEQDLQQLARSPAQVRDALHQLGLGLTDYQVLRDVDGAADAQRDGCRAHALQMLETAAALGAGVVQAPANTRTDVVPAWIVEDLRWLGRAAAEHGLRIAYEPMAWSTVNHTLPAAWASVRASGADNIDLVVDAYHLFAPGRGLDDLDAIPATRIANVQLCDVAQPVAPGALAAVARHARLLPGEGCFPLSALLRRLAGMGYTGPIGIEVFNDVRKAAAAPATAAAAMAALRSCLERTGA
ncbi:sugar phosphate isomerase/epimerase family protein [Xanthomonas sp. WHRI 7065]|uniref:sugar phosphate isomerase/epimerase family protein n=1 Tax=Xanthomonas sp. WHRI 7065 TaxID=3161569 RepID=UPI0032E8D418